VTRPETLFCPRCARAFRGGEEACTFDGARLTRRFLDFIPHKSSRQTGAILGERYKLAGEIDRGATARIYLAEDLFDPKPVVVKVLEPRLADDAKKRERFMREAEAAKIVDHPNVADAFFIGTRGDGTPFFVMEFLFGESLGARLRREPKLDEKIVLRIALDVAAGLDAAHDACVFHRDIKPDNLFLVGEIGDHYTVKIVDFGYAKAGDTSITGGGMVIGTAEYMAPEQCLSDPVDGRADIYALGAVMYRALTGELLVSADAPMDVRLAEQVTMHPLPPEEVSPALAIALRCLRKEPDARYESAAELIGDLRRALDGKPTAASQNDADPPYQPRTDLAREVYAIFVRRLREARGGRTA